MSSVPAISAELQQWILEVTGADRVEVKQVPGGASRQAWFVDAHGRAGGEKLFLRYDPHPPKPGSAFHPLQVEAEIMAELCRHGVTVPRVLAAHPVEQAVLLERIGGDTWFRLIKDPEVQVRTAQDFIAKLSYLHRIDAASLDIPSLGPAGPVPGHVRDELTRMRRRVAAHGKPAPLVSFCIDWLESHIPDYDGPTVLVQGDTGPGNFMYADGKVTAIVDWELAHFGDPMDDIAWLSLRTVQDTFTHFPDRIAEYGRHSGHQVDEDRVWYYRLFAETRLASMNPSGIDARSSVPVHSPDAGNSLIYGMLHRRLLIEALARVVGISDVEVELPDEDRDSEHAAVYAATAAALSDAVGRSTDALATRYIKGAARLVKYLAEVDRVGAQVDAAELAELTELLGETPASVSAGRAALADRVARGELGERDYVTQLWRGIKRDDYLTRTASGALRHRTWPDLHDSSETGVQRWESPSPKTTVS
ncbi:phosphotransferase family protein [Mycolicibacterium holsaticum]|uniref:phosphotransferase family protein n=1 Tax=Mycolicibacterium holsaticum TaxID=152142 RepID=UPI001C7CDB11|nr:phosphotransferase family protein [Mycolicibacterium holsaticum]MDA4108119.1 phosphotransferase [Mycolicibacterium holsaticum DSM 44478 = JCM 12374]QZA14468.1 phosphotransferase family protein [Mycolicibacterium holsaticum DSM 44478 = JCM 12374]UNC08083.1 phosphotransferase family protein [Mycolicibacterium holsaticum DSM 44478 = JCM 12374]